MRVCFSKDSFQGAAPPARVARGTHTRGVHARARGARRERESAVDSLRGVTSTARGTLAVTRSRLCSLPLSPRARVLHGSGLRAWWHRLLRTSRRGWHIVDQYITYRAADHPILWPYLRIRRAHPKYALCARGKFLGFQDSRIPGSPRIPEDSTPAGFQDSRIPRIPGFPGFLVFPPSILWSILRGNGAHTPIQDLESYEYPSYFLREVLTASLPRPRTPGSRESRLARAGLWRAPPPAPRRQAPAKCR